MILKRISILNYKNLEQVELDFSAKMNCFIGQNGMGKTNLLDAVYYLSFCKSATNPIDSQNMMHHQDFFVIQGFYETEMGDTEEIYCGMKRRQKKLFKRNKKEYTRLSDHIGFVPLVMVSPSDAELISGGSEERRRFMDVVISQYDKEYLEALIRYNKALQQRNTLLKSEQGFDEELMEVWEEMMAASGEVVYRKRCAFIEEFIPYIESTYRIKADKRTRAIAGLSMGGYGTMFYTMRHPELFSSACPISARMSGTPYNKNRSYTDEYITTLDSLAGVKIAQSLSDEQIAALRQVRLRVDCGDDDYLFDGNVDFVRALRSHKIPVEFRVRDGGHSWIYWQTALPDILTYVSIGFME